ncbi:hypothetical protein F511_23338 [Dorcoceras hygrometricum]|uniref:Uncharacterized protein n=1 Tax=Dorcoceras hygrometricum TaxID=472368 RepID=A0A2Z7AAM6_9LAMI|nr:hypothetical protein F511_23338 [Dorcoceras hygrometricum]
MGIYQLGFQSVQLGYLKILQLGNTAPNNKKQEKEYEENRSPSPANQLAVISIEPLYPHSVSTGEIIVVNKSSTRTFSSQVLPQQISPGTAISAYTNCFLTGHGTPTGETVWELICQSISKFSLRSSLRKRSSNTATSCSLSNVASSHLTGINRKSYSRRAQHHRSRSKQRRKTTTIYGEGFG